MAMASPARSTQVAAVPGLAGAPDSGGVPGADSTTPPVLWALLFGNFVIGTGVMTVPGNLNYISASLEVTIPVAGQLISVSSILMCFAAPLLASVVAGWDRRRLLAYCMLWFAVLHVICAFAPGFTSLLLLRCAAMLAAAVYTPQAAACVGLLVPENQRARAITLVLMGWSVASVLGMPLGSWIGGQFGWRSAFVVIAVLSLVSSAWIVWRMPNGIRPTPFSAALWHQILASKAIMWCLVATVLSATGQFVLFAYFAPYLKHVADVTPTQLSLYFAWFGAIGLLGNVLLTRSIGNWGTDTAAFISIALMALSFLLWPLGTGLWLVGLVSVPWALGCFASNSAQQARLVGIAPGLAGGTVALNSAGMYAGQAIGAASGGALINQGYILDLHWAGLVLLVLGLLASWWTQRYSNPL